MELKETVDGMSSPDFKERFIAEYNQLYIRYTGLLKMLESYKNGTLTFTPKCSYELLFEQSLYMFHYLTILEARAEIEDINLNIE